ncbi:N-formylglutamate amidohydrolase [Roseibium sediminicola]|uniref:N-formylglutamate amidohydrolase n=1 Tax=Roseibium sediminicola TaxID=2933272 RepID=A0ABT0GYR6_9HYPH|nr:N-formylglutamate amidohydrolase [Roseibium sp. CAU 1639]MCK7613963.1 N-formylglutamate amidohydrolase [Roseibium sp. CAU 1639]
MILVEEGQSPLILCLPHSGTEIPNAVEKRLNATGRLQADLAWRLERVFDFHEELDATVLRSSISRYVIDLDKDPKTTLAEASDPARALCPATTLDGKRIYQEGEEPGPTEIEQRSLLFYTPFHKALRRQVDRLMRQHRKVIIVDCQSMRSHIKGVTDKGLPLVSIGTQNGTSCDPDLRNTLVGSFKGQQGYTVSVDEQTHGGFITKSFGKPERGLHAMTLLIAQRAYLRHESPPFEPDKTRITRLRAVLTDSMSRLIDWTGMSGTSTVATPSDEGAVPESGEAGPEATGDNTAPVQAGPDNQSANAEIIPVDPMTLPKVSSVQTGKVEDGPVTPLLVAE